MSGFFRFYGLNVQVPPQLGELLDGWMPPAKPPSDISLTLKRGAPSSDASCWMAAFDGLDTLSDGTPEFRAERHETSGDLRLTYHDGVAFTVDAAGSGVEICLPPSVPTAALLPALLGPIMGVAMRQRGVVCLHASAVALGQQAIALVGDSGAGKSTTAAAFARRGRAVLGDDVLPLTHSGGAWVATPAYPKLRLWPESAAALMGSADALPPMMPGWDKRALDLGQHAMAFQSEPLPLSAIYFLGPRRDTQTAFTDVAPADALMRLVSDSFASRAQSPVQRAAEFRFLAELVRSLPLRQVSASNDLGQLDALCAAIEADAARLLNAFPDGC